MANYVYFIQEAESPWNIKIGSSNNPDRRLQSLKTGNSKPLELRAILYWPDKTKSVEKVLHRTFAHDHVHGEWFSNGCTQPRRSRM